MSTTQLEFPSFYHIPPFYTFVALSHLIVYFLFSYIRRQKVASTRSKQIDLWQDFILKYCKAKNIQRLDINKVAETELFYNRKIESFFYLPLSSLTLTFPFLQLGKVPVPFIREILDGLVANGMFSSFSLSLL